VDGGLVPCRYLGRPRAWPAGDLALRKAVRELYGDVDVRAAGERFDPFQNLTAHYLLAQFLTP
jgi:3-methyladenine DNA glycosylase/8-oxoguanine DNA glycosylase